MIAIVADLLKRWAWLWITFALIPLLITCFRPDPRTIVAWPVAGAIAFSVDYASRRAFVAWRTRPVTAKQLGTAWWLFAVVLVPAASALAMLGQALLVGERISAQNLAARICFAFVIIASAGLGHWLACAARSRGKSWLAIFGDALFGVSMGLWVFGYSWLLPRLSEGRVPLFFLVLPVFMLLSWWMAIQAATGDSRVKHAPKTGRRSLMESPWAPAGPRALVAQLAWNVSAIIWAMAAIFAMIYGLILRKNLWSGAAQSFMTALPIMYAPLVGIASSQSLRHLRALPMKRSQLAAILVGVPWLACVANVAILGFLLLGASESCLGLVCMGSLCAAICCGTVTLQWRFGYWPGLVVLIVLMMAVPVVPALMALNASWRPFIPVACGLLSACIVLAAWCFATRWLQSSHQMYRLLPQVRAAFR